MTSWAVDTGAHVADGNLVIATVLVAQAIDFLRVVRAEVVGVLLPVHAFEATIGHFNGPLGAAEEAVVRQDDGVGVIAPVRVCCYLVSRWLDTAVSVIKIVEWAVNLAVTQVIRVVNEAELAVF